MLKTATTHFVRRPFLAERAVLMGEPRSNDTYVHLSGIRESNPFFKLGKLALNRSTNPAVKCSASVLGPTPSGFSKSHPLAQNARG